MRALLTLLSLFSAALLLSGCGRGGAEAPLNPAKLSSAESQRAQLVPDHTGWPADPFDFQEVRIVGDTLVATLSYGGGCAEHGFALVFANLFLESYPVQMRGVLSHDARGDRCRALLTRTLRFDLTPLKELYLASYRTDSGVIVLGGNWPRSLRYEF